MTPYREDYSPAELKEMREAREKFYRDGNHWVADHFAVENGVRKFVTGHWSKNPEITFRDSAPAVIDTYNDPEEEKRIRDYLRSMRDLRGV